MNDFVTLVIMGIGGYLLWRFVIAAWLGLKAAGDRLERNLPSVFEKFWVSLATGVATGFVVGLMSNGTAGTATAFGVTLAKLVIDVISEA